MSEPVPETVQPFLEVDGIWHVARCPQHPGHRIVRLTVPGVLAAFAEHLADRHGVGSGVLLGQHTLDRRG